jgi:hypothetical protein
VPAGAFSSILDIGIDWIGYQSCFFASQNFLFWLTIPVPSLPDKRVGERRR